MMISKEMNKKLNAQLTAELAAAHQYMAMYCTFDEMGYKILAKRFFQQCEEERVHATKILNYILEAGGAVKLEAIGKPKGEFASVEELVQAALDGEMEITRSIHDIVALAEKEKDYATRSYLGWFVDEQVEEVASMRDLLQLVQLSSGNILMVENRVRHDMMAEGS